MKKSVISKLLTAMIMVSIILIPSEKTNAAEVNIVDGSALTFENQSISNAIPNMRGIYLQNGSSAIVKASSGSVYANGDTVANKACTVSVNVILEKSSGGSWSRVTSWTATNYDSIYVTATKTVSVGSGYYYRVRSVHYAASESMSSYTNGLYM